MKKFLLYLAAFTAVFTACTKELEQIENKETINEDEEPVKEDVQTYTLVAGYPETKTTLSGNVFNWAEGETVAVADGTTTPKVFSISEDADERAAGKFTYTGSLTGDLRFAVTPASAATVPATSGSNVTIALPTNYTYVAGQTNAVMVSTAPVLEGGKYTTHFAHAMALIKVSYTNVPIGTKYFKLTMDQNIAGGSVTIDASTTPEIKIADIVSTPSKSVTVTLTSAVSVANTSMDFYVPVPTGTYGKFTVQLCDASDNVLSEKNRDMAAAGKSLTLGRADVFATPGITLPQQKVLNFDFTSAVTGWKQSKATAASGDFTYTIDEVGYSFNLTKNGNGIYQSDPGGSKSIYLMVNSGETLGLPVIAGYRLTKVIVSNSVDCSTSAKIGIISNTSTKAYVDDAASTQTLTTQNSSYTFTLSDSYAGKRYYIYAADKNTQVYSIELTYAESTRTFTPSALTMNDISCSARTATSLTYSWTGVTNAVGYKISTDGGSSYGETQLATSYTWSGLPSFTSNTIYVKAIGDGVEFYDSTPNSATDKTTLTVPTGISWTEGTKTVSWTDANTAAGTYGSVYKYIYTLDGGSTSSDATTSTTATLSIDSTTDVKIKAVCLSDATLSSDWTDGLTCSISGGAKTNQVLFHETFGDNSGSARVWNDSYSVKSGVSAVYSGLSGYSISNAKQSKNTMGSTKSGLTQTTAGTDAYIIIGPLSVASAENMVLTYQWKAASISKTYSTSLYYKTSAGGSFTEVSGSGSGATTYVERTYNLPAAAQVGTLYLKIVWNTSNTQALIDEVNLQGDY